MWQAAAATHQQNEKLSSSNQKQQLACLGAAYICCDTNELLAVHRLQAQSLKKQLADPVSVAHY